MQVIILTDGRRTKGTLTGFTDDDIHNKFDTSRSGQMDESHYVSFVWAVTDSPPKSPKVFLFNADANWLPGSASFYGYYRQPVL